VDGKAVRAPGTPSSDGQAVHLLAVIDQQAGAVFAQAGVDGKPMRSPSSPRSWSP
jgi:hypothetical protein